jgi:hypothetical protein
VGSNDGLDEAVLCALVAREWRWRRSSVAEVALAPFAGTQRWQVPASAQGVWITEGQLARSLRAVEERITRAERAAHALLDRDESADSEPSHNVLVGRRGAGAAGRVAFAREAYASARARWRSADHPECLRAQARLLEAHLAESESHAQEPGGEGARREAREDLRIAALRRRWEAAERSGRASAQERALAFRRLVQAASAVQEPTIRIARTSTPPVTGLR